MYGDSYNRRGSITPFAVSSSMDRVGATETRDVPHDRHLFRERRWQMHDYWFGEALGELRSGVVLQVAIIANAFGLDVEDDLANVLPMPDESNPLEP